jgi:hypothetical protein
MIAKSKFSCATDKVFNGYSTLQRWNGWDCPLFTIGQARKVIKYLNEQQSQSNCEYYDKFTYLQGEDVILQETFEDGKVINESKTSPLIFQGVKYYDVANCDYTWEEIRN